MRRTTDQQAIGMPAARAALLCCLTLAAFALSVLPGTAAAAPCPNEQFRTGLGENLPDCRAYEQASPSFKNGSAVEGVPSIFTTPEDGSGVTWFSISASSVPTSSGGTGGYPEYFSKRVGTGWATQRLFPPPLPVGPGAFNQIDSYLGITPDGRFGLARAEGANCGGQVCSSLWVIDTQAEDATPIATANGQQSFAFDGASSDGSRFFFESRAQLLPEAVEGVVNLYMWTRGSGTISVVGVLPGAGSAGSSSGAFGGPYEWDTGEVYAGGATAGDAVQAAHAISTSGDQIFFTVPEATGELGEFQFGQLFLRRGLTGSNPSSLRISKPNDGVTNPNADLKPAAFQEATPDGTHAFFLSTAKLTADATTGPTEESNDLYRWDRTTEQVVDVTPDTSDANGAEVVGLLGASHDGSRGFFVAKGVLALGGTANEFNIYRFAESIPGKFNTEFIATLNKQGSPDLLNWVPRALPAGEGLQFGEGRDSRVSPNGETLLFTSVNPLTSFSNEAASCGATEPSARPNGPGGKKLCIQIYRYSQSDHKIDCVSCPPSGRLLGGDASLQQAIVGGPQVPFVKPAADFSRNLSANGLRVFFQTTEPLVASDINGGEGCLLTSCTDVYEWEAPGEGSCQAGSSEYSAENSGCVYLISPGQSPASSRQASYFLGASANGDNAFIGSNNALVSTDIDEAFDAYDVSVGGGLASQHQTAEAVCAGEECQRSSGQSSSATIPATSAVNGPGNRHPRRPGKSCHKGKKHSGHCKRAGTKHHVKKKRKSAKHSMHGASGGRHRGDGGSR